MDNLPKIRMNNNVINFVGLWLQGFLFVILKYGPQFCVCSLIGQNYTMLNSDWLAEKSWTGGGLPLCRTLPGAQWSCSTWPCNKKTKKLVCNWYFYIQQASLFMWQGYIQINWFCIINLSLRHAAGFLFILLN